MLSKFNRRLAGSLLVLIFLVCAHVAGWTQFVTQGVLAAGAVWLYPASSGGTWACHYTAGVGGNTAIGSGSPTSISAGATQDNGLCAAGAHQIYSVWVAGSSTNPCSVKIYDSATNGVTSSSTVYNSAMIGANPTGIGGSYMTLVGQQFSAGIAFRITLNLADNDANAVASGACTFTINYSP